VKRLLAWTWPVECFPAQCSHVKCSVAFPFQSYHGRREHTAGIPCYCHENLENLEIVRDYNNHPRPCPFMMKDRELELNFPCVLFFMLRWQVLTVTAVIPIVWLDFSKICLPHPSTMASLMFCQFAKFLPKRKTCGRTRQRPAMTDFHCKVNKFWQRFPKCNPYLYHGGKKKFKLH